MLVFAIAAFSSPIDAQSAYDFNITTLDGQQHSLNEYAGKTIAIVIIPSTHNSADSLLLDSIYAIASTYQDSLNIICIPSYETGYKDDSLGSLSVYYDSLLKAPCIVSLGITTSKTSPYQDPLFAWLTTETQNGHFDQDVQGVGQSFFIDKSGQLYGVLGPDQPFNYELILKMMQASSGQTQ